MSNREGMTLIEIIVVLVIIGVVAAFFLPNYTMPFEQARAANAQNNLLAIYSAQQNYSNNNGSFALGSVLTPTLAAIDSILSLNIQDDGTYKYDCGVTTPNACTATRNNGPAALSITVTLNTPIQLTGEINPACSAPGNSNWCP